MLENISPEEKSYLIGFLQGDGSHYEQSKNKGKISIELSNRDIDILDKIEILLNDVHVGRYDRIHDTGFKKNFKSSSLYICNLNMRKKLKPYVPVGKKSCKIKPPINMEKFDKYSYIRGLFDADGSLGITAENKPFWSLCTSSEKIKDFILFDIKNKLNAEKRINRNKRDNVYNIVLFNEDAIKYTSILYHNATIYLDRKYNKFLEICKWERTAPKRPGRSKRWLPYEDKVVLTDLLLKEKMKLLDRSASSIKTRAWRLKQQ